MHWMITASGAFQKPTALNHDVMCVCVYFCQILLFKYEFLQMKQV